jgi:hypothetical protein
MKVAIFAILLLLSQLVHAAPYVVASSDRLAPGQHTVLTHDLCYGRNQAPGVYMWQSFMSGMKIDQGCYVVERDKVWPIGLPFYWNARDFEWFNR